MNQIVLATKNKGKIKEMREWVDAHSTLYPHYKVK